MSRSRIEVTLAVQPEMNVTPLVDVVLVLLIIFMVVAPRLNHDVPVILPGVMNPDPVSGVGSDALQVSVTAAGVIYIDDQPHSRDEALAVLQTVHAADPLRRMAIRGDERITYGQVRALCAQAQKIGFPGVALMVSERHGPWSHDRS